MVDSFFQQQAVMTQLGVEVGWHQDPAASARTWSLLLLLPTWLGCSVGKAPAVECCQSPRLWVESRVLLMLLASPLDNRLSVSLYESLKVVIKLVLLRNVHQLF